MRHAVLTVVVPMSVLACADSGAPGAYAVRDSAGVEIVESFRPSWSGAAAWHIGASPSLRIGVTEGDASYEFSDVVGAVRLAGGAIVVADGGSREVRMFDPSGRFLRAVGGNGAGPGEFTNLSALGRAPDGGVWAYDFALRRVTWLDASGGIVQITSIGPDPPMLNPIGALPDGSLVLKQSWAAQQTADATRTGLRRDPVAYVRIGRDGVVRDTVGLFPGRETVLTTEDGRGVMNTPLFGRNSHGAVRGDGIVVGSATRFELDVVAPDGRPLRRWRIPDRELSLQPGQLEQAIEERVLAAPEQRRPELRMLYRSFPVPDAVPAYAALLTDATNHVWVAEWTPDPRLPEKWTVFDPEGRWLGDVAMPAGFYPFDIGDRWILGVEHDRFDVESVVVYGVEKPRSNSP